MGIGGLSLAWRNAGEVWSVPTVIADVLFWVAAIVYLVLAALYLWKWLRFPREAWDEAHEPMCMPFVPTPLIALLIVSAAGQNIIPVAMTGVWWFASVGQLVMTVWIVNAWARRSDIGMDQITPAWFIPLAGNMIAPLGAVELGPTEFAWISFGVGLVLWLAMLPVVFARLVVHDALTDELAPTVSVLIAPPAVAVVSWEVLTGSLIDPFGRILFSATLIFVAILLIRLPQLWPLPWGLPQLAYGFPLASAASAGMLVALEGDSVVYTVLAALLLTLATFAVGSMAVRAGLAAVNARRRAELHGKVD